MQSNSNYVTDVSYYYSNGVSYNDSEYKIKNRRKSKIRKFKHND